MAHTFVSTEEEVGLFVHEIARLPTKPPALYLDLEGAQLSRHGTLSLITVYVQPLDHTYIIDVTTLKDKAFNTVATNKSAPVVQGIIDSHAKDFSYASESSAANCDSMWSSSLLDTNSNPTASTSMTNITFKSILESSTITKVFFDVRNDSDALYSHYGICLAGIEDVQLQEVASRPSYQPKKFLRGLAKCIANDIHLPRKEKAEWTEVKNSGVHLFAPERGGSYAVFDQRPLADVIVRYCVNDVRYLPLLRDEYLPLLDARWKAQVALETKRRVVESQSETYQPQGKNKVVSPWANELMWAGSLLAELTFEL